MGSDLKAKALQLIRDHKDVLGTVLDFNIPAKIDIQGEISFKLPSATWSLSDIGSVKNATKKPVIV